MDRNEKGQMLLDPEALAKKAAGDRFSRYNGGWIREVTRIDKTQTNGYSLVGNFLKGGKQWLSPGVYVDCSIGGSRKHREKRYTAFRLDGEGEVHVLGTAGDSRDWAVRLWPAIEQGLKEAEEEKMKETPASPEAAAEKLKELMKKKEELEKELEMVLAQIQLLSEIAGGKVE